MIRRGTALGGAQCGRRALSGAAAAPRASWIRPRTARRAAAAKRWSVPPETVLGRYSPFVDAAPEAWVRTWAGRRLGIVRLDRAVFGSEPRVDVLHRVVEWQRQRRRAPAKATLTRAEVAGSGKKPYKQKGTGRARRSTLKSAPHMKGGGKAMGPKQREFGYSMPKKVRRLAMCHALSAKAAEGNLVVVDKAWLPLHRTKYLKQLLAEHGLLGERTLLIDGDDALDGNFHLASRGVRELRVMHVKAANVLDILTHRNLVLTLSAVRALEARILRHEAAEPHAWEAARDEDSELVGAFAASEAARKAGAAAAAEAEAEAEADAEAEPVAKQ